MQKKALPKNAINGWLNISKPIGVTSNDVVIWLKKIMRPKKIGHAGTLDPFATGVLQIAMGEATKTIEYAQERLKDYNFVLKFGFETTTEDIEGEASVFSDKIPSIAEIEAILPSFIGIIEQVPPKFSAVKINGQRAYDLARAGQVFEIKSKKVNIVDLRLNSQISESEYYFSVTCGKGTYIRSLGRDIARSLGSAAHLTLLERTMVGGFSVADAIKLSSREETLQLSSEYFISQLKSVDAVLDDIPVLHLGTDDCNKLRNGVKVQIHAAYKNDLVRVYDDKKIIAVASIEAADSHSGISFVKPVKIINH